MMAVVRVSEMPDAPVPSVRRKCASCQRAVWVSKRNAKLAERCELVCPPCLIGRAIVSRN